MLFKILYLREECFHQGSEELEAESSPGSLAPGAIELKAEKGHHSHVVINPSHQREIQLLLYMGHR